MSVVMFIFRSMWRSRLRAWTSVALLVALACGFALAAFQAGERTASAYPRLLAATSSADVLVLSGRTVGLANLRASRIASLPGVDSSSGLPFFNFSAASTGQSTFDFAYVIGLPATRSSLFRPKLVAGVEPSPTKPDEVLASYNLT